MAATNAGGQADDSISGAYVEGNEGPVEIDPDYLFAYGEEESIYCEVCKCSMSGPKNFEAHVVGARHRKNVKNSEMGAPIKSNRTGLPTLLMKNGKVVNWPPKCQAMLDTCEQPLLGLQFVTEWCHKIRQVEPRYNCVMCSAKCDVRMLPSHLSGAKHRLSYMKLFYPEMILKIKQQEQKQDQSSMIDEYTKEIESIEGRQELKIRAEGFEGHYVDDDYAEYAALVEERGTWREQLQMMEHTQLNPYDYDDDYFPQPMARGRGRMLPRHLMGGLRIPSASHPSLLGLHSGNPFLPPGVRRPTPLGRRPVPPCIGFLPPDFRPTPRGVRASFMGVRPQRPVIHSLFAGLRPSLRGMRPPRPSIRPSRLDAYGESLDVDFSSSEVDPEYTGVYPLMSVGQPKPRRARPVGEVFSLLAGVPPVTSRSKAASSTARHSTSLAAGMSTGDYYSYEAGADDYYDDDQSYEYYADAQHDADSYYQDEASYYDEAAATQMDEQAVHPSENESYFYDDNISASSLRMFEGNETQNFGSHQQPGAYRRSVPTLASRGAAVGRGRGRGIDRSSMSNAVDQDDDDSLMNEAIAEVLATYKAKRVAKRLASSAGNHGKEPRYF